MRRHEIAHLISEITNPLFIALPTFLIIALSTAPDIWHALLWWIIATAGISLAPLLFIWHGVRVGHYTDHHISMREQRLFPLFFGFISITVSFILLFLLHASKPLIVTMSAVIVAVGLAAIITQKWKISLHLVGAAGAVTVFGLLFGWQLALLLAPGVLLIAWARWHVRAHTPLQVLAGAALAIAVTLVLFWLFP